MPALNDLERAVLDLMLAGDHPVLTALRAQAATCQVTERELTGVGFFAELAVVAEAAPVAGRVTFGDVEAQIPGLAHGAGFVLFIQGGVMQMLEGYCYDEPWPERTDGLVLRYGAEPRDLSKLDPPGDQPGS